ncbi:hypothetical protein AYL99_03155 [Fonsecaea erecta]|uniref:G domain-containing protein n=1 Tax=Fonsecaea erecta TaxID=1367422 RepID=A0A178ZVW0_9EURO|nr:hypothetical protein AYL99_03155 [Fonsecaea erecta]OAP63928.1 hypothetical protein AYL99_03155 [Fonsecaea erecta]
MESTTHDIGSRTQYCLDQIKNRASNEPAKVIIILGGKDEGKSILFEDLTSARGHARDDRGPGTTAFQLEELIINGEQFFIMDSPGFGAGDEVEVFFEVARGIKAIYQHATIVGVLFVASVNSSRVGNLDRKLPEFLKLFCGDEFVPRITFVTTHWTHPDAAQSNRFAQLRSLWWSFLAGGAGLYHHGRKYNNQHEDTGICLTWPSNRDEIAGYARNMVSRHYGGVEAPVLRILTELDRGNGLYLTSAAKFLRASANTYHEPEGNRSGGNTAQDQPPRQPEPQGTERTKDHVPSAGPDLMNAAWNKLANLALNYGVEFIGNTLESQFVGRGPSRPSFSSRPSVCSRDLNSVVDVCKLLGIPSDIESREALGAGFGISNVGTAEGNTALLEILKGWL